jgi:high-affinity nickel-transport protein
MNLDAFLLVAGIGGGIGVYAAALALGIRHGIDWDHIAAITDITSASSSVGDEDESWLIGEPGLMLTDETHHSVHGPHDGHEHEAPDHTHVHGHDDQHEHRSAFAATASGGGAATATLTRPASSVRTMVQHIPRRHRESIWLGSLYAIGHGTVVVILGVLAIVASEFLPDWIDPIMEKVVGVTLIFLAVYLFYSLYQYFRGGEFHLRSRWMLVFAGVRNALGWLRSRTGQHEHVHVTPQQYSARTAYGIGLIHGIGAETGTQALIIATAVGATSQGVAIAALMAFVVGLLISNSFVTLASTVGFVSARRRQTIYVVAGMVAAVFSLVLGLVFISESTGILPDLDRYVRWVGGPQ